MDQRSAERRAPDRGECFEALAAASRVPLALLDPDGSILAANPAFAARLDRTPEEVEGRRPREAGFSDDAVRRLTVQIRRVAATGTAAMVPDLRPGLGLRLTPVRDDAGRVWAVAAAAAAEGRTETLAECRNAASRILSSANHDLRQPLQAMHLFHHLLAGKLTDPDARSLCAKLGEAIANGEMILQGIVDVARLEAGLVEPVIEPVDVDGLLARLLEAHDAPIRARGLRFLVRPTEAAVLSDAALLERLAGALVAHAMGAVRRGGVLVGARRRGDRLRLEVWDTGPGLADEDRERVVEGFGPLGLAFRLARVLGHDLTLKRGPAGGSVARVDLPLAAIPGLEPKRAATIATP